VSTVGRNTPVEARLQLYFAPMASGLAVVKGTPDVYALNLNFALDTAFQFEL
jgi:hypothetical protein